MKLKALILIIIFAIVIDANFTENPEQDPDFNQTLTSVPKTKTRKKTKSVSLSEEFNEEEIKYLDLLEEIRSSEGSIYGVCMKLKLKIGNSKKEDIKVLRHIKTSQEGFFTKVLIKESEEADWHCTYGFFLKIIGIGFISGLSAACCCCYILSNIIQVKTKKDSHVTSLEDGVRTRTIYSQDGNIKSIATIRN